jgi:hypothetical protein
MTNARKLLGYGGALFAAALLGNDPEDAARNAETGNILHTRAF